MTGPLTTVAVVIPAHDEETLLGRCLSAVAESRDELALRRPDVTTYVVVVLDRCRDDSAEIARAHRVDRVLAEFGAVGAARRVGVERAAALSGHVDPAHTWIATSDADSVVPRGWLTSQLRAADRGAMLVVGPVRPDPDDLTPALYAAWRRRHLSTETGRHVHGANLGFRLDAYLACGGFQDVTEHEDVLLVEALLRSGTPMAAGLPVTTSGRRVGRAGGGFAGYLRGLGAEVTPAVVAPGGVGALPSES